MKTSENDVKNSNFDMREMDKSRELYSTEEDNSSHFELKTMPWEHTIAHDSSDMLQLKTILKVFYPADVVLLKF